MKKTTRAFSLPFLTLFVILGIAFSVPQDQDEIIFIGVVRVLFDLVIIMFYVIFYLIPNLL